MKTIAECDREIRQNPNDAGAYNDRGALYCSNGYFDKAIADLTKSIQLNPNPNNVEAYCNRGLTYMNIGEVSKAFDDYNKVIEMYPRNAEAYARRGSINSELGKTQEAIHDFEEFLRLDPYNTNAKLVRDELRQLKIGIQRTSDYIATKEREQSEQYERLVRKMDKASTENEYLELAKKFRAMNGYKDTIELADKCEKQYGILKEIREEQERKYAPEIESFKQRMRPFWRNGLILQFVVTAALCFLIFSGLINTIYGKFLEKSPSLLLKLLVLVALAGIPTIIIGIISKLLRKGARYGPGIFLIILIDIVLSISMAVSTANGFFGFIGYLIMYLIIFSIAAIPGTLMWSAEGVLTVEEILKANEAAEKTAKVE